MKHTRVFKDSSNLQSLKKLRRIGYTYHSLAFIFNVDHSSVYHHCKGIKPRMHRVFDLPNILSSFNVDTDSIVSLLGIGVKRDKTYAEYLAESRYRERFPHTYHIFK